MSKQNNVDIYSDSKKKRKKGKGGKIAAIIIVVILVLALLGAAWVWFFNRDLIKDILPQEETQPSSTAAEVTTAELTTAEPTAEPATVAEIEVPDVSGYAAKDAYYKLNSVGLRYTVVREYSEDVKAEYVISQEPKPGEIIKQNDRVTLHISKGIDHPPETTVESTTSATEPTKKPGDKKKGSYILDGSDTRIISRSEVEKLDDDELTLALNEIFARHGRRFKTPSIQAYFDKQEWYKGTIDPEDFDENVLSGVERANINTILSVMDDR